MFWGRRVMCGFASVVVFAAVAPAKGPGRGGGSSETLDDPKALAGQIIVDPAHPAWLKRNGGGPVHLCGPGDPEGFLYRGTRRLDGTRDGDQEALIRKLIEHGGDGRRDHNPFVDSDPAQGLDKRLLDQWQTWFDLMDRHGIAIVLFFYDDSASIWRTADRVGPQEKAFVEGIVGRFRHHRNLIWVVAEARPQQETERGPRSRDRRCCRRTTAVRCPRRHTSRR